ncbi:hypothetical protein [Caulobacter sp. DWP3-1-3b2]|uniref:hypothetical protein n=1 Tax=Caulobacter sp. DWP3-1-3b2 TaxID=2804643 RepID=UPI003CE93760
MPNLPKPHLIAAIAGIVLLASLGAGVTAYLLRDARTEVADHRTDAAEAQAVNFGKVFSHWDDEIPSV